MGISNALKVDLPLKFCDPPTKFPTKIKNSDPPNKYFSEIFNLPSWRGWGKGGGVHAMRSSKKSSGKSSRRLSCSSRSSSSENLCGGTSIETVALEEKLKMAKLLAEVSFTECRENKTE